MRKWLNGSIMVWLIGTGIAFSQNSTPPKVLIAGLPNASAQIYTQSVDGTPVLLPAQIAGETPDFSSGKPSTIVSSESNARPGCLPDPCDVCCKRYPRFWANADYLLWFLRDQPNSGPLVTVGPRSGGGVVGTPGTIVVYGDQPLDYGGFNGGRVEVGGWFNPATTFGLEANGFLLESRSDTFQVSNSNVAGTIIARSFLDTSRVPPVESASLVALPPEVTGSVFARAPSRFWGAEMNAIANLRDRSCYRVDLLGGFRYFDLQESIGIGSVSVQPPVMPVEPIRGQINTVPGFTVTTDDAFECRNQFYGGQLGARLGFTWGRVNLAWTTKVALGINHETLDIFGRTVTAFDSVTFSSPTGFLARASNSGHFVNDTLAVLPETGVKVGFRFTERLTGYVGYSLIYLSEAIRPGDQIDRGITPDVFIPSLGLIPSPNAPSRPAASMHSTDVFVQGVSFGLGFTY